jgi:O-antigen ligase
VPLYFLASIAGLFPALTLPLGVGWKAIHVFDLLFAASLALSVRRRGLRSPDRRLIAAGAALVMSAALALWIHPSPLGLHAVLSLGYSVVVLLATSHVRLDTVGVRVDRVILWPLFIAIGIAWLVFLIENVTGMPIGENQSPMLPAGVHRLGGFTGGNTLVLFLCLAAPLARTAGPMLFGIVLPAFATLSRSLLGVGVALALGDHASTLRPPRLRRAVLLASWLGISVSLFIYAFAVIPVTPSQRTPLSISLDAGGYLTPHLAALRMLRSQPLLGVGPSAFAGEFEAFTSPEERERLPADNRSLCDPHSAILGLAAEQGLLGLAAFAWLIHQIFTRFKLIQDPYLRGAAMAGLTGLLVGGHFVDWLALKGLWLWIGLLVASQSSAQGNLHGTSK